MLSELYQSIDSPEEQGKNIVLPAYSTKAIYLSERGELFCYSGIYGRDNDAVSFNSWPYYLEGKHTTNNQYIRGLFRIKSGCILLTGFVDHEFYNNRKYKQLTNYIMRLPTVNELYFGIEKRVETENSWHYEENIELSRECFGLSYSELESLIKWYAKILGTYNAYFKYPRLTRSLKKDNFCSITGVWIPAGFPYITFDDYGNDFSHVSLFGFYRHINLLLSLGTRKIASEIFESGTFNDELINRVLQVDDFFPFEIIVTREYIISEMYV